MPAHSQNVAIPQHSHPPPQQQQQQQQHEQQDEQRYEDEQHHEKQREQDATSIEPQHDEQKQDRDAASPHDLDSADEAEDSNPPQEYIYVDLLAIRKEVQCPICLGIIKKTRTVMECLHRFCRVCIDKSMRMGNNECPACRTHCASRRSLRDDPRFDELIAALYPDIKKFEEEELAFYEEDESRNKQIQESITEVIAKQTEALGKKRGNKDTAGPSTARPQKHYSSTQPKKRGRRKQNGSTEYQHSDDNIDANDSDKQFSADEQPIKRKRKRRVNRAMSQSPSTTNLSGGSCENNVEQCKEERGLSPGLVCTPEMLVWGRGGVRSTTRHGNANASMNRSDQRTRLAKLVDFLRNLEENDDEAQLLGRQDTNGLADHQSTFQSLSVDNEKLSRVAVSFQDKFDELDKEAAHLRNCVLNGEQLVSAFQQKAAI